MRVSLFGSSGLFLKATAAACVATSAVGHSSAKESTAVAVEDLLAQTEKSTITGGATKISNAIGEGLGVVAKEEQKNSDKVDAKIKKEEDAEKKREQRKEDKEAAQKRLDQ